MAAAAVETHHPTASQYVRVAIILCIFTAVEVVVYYMEPLRQMNLLPPILIALSAAKFATVVGYYMHLRFDHRVFTFFFATGLTVGGFIILVLMALFGVFIHSGTPIKSISTQAALATASPKAPATSGQEAAGAPRPAVDPSTIGDAANGKALFVSKGCTGCHMAPGVPGSATVGPNQAGYANRPKTAGGTLDNTPANTEKWLTNPPAVKPGTLMPNLGLSPQEIKDLTAFLYSLK